MKKIDNILYNVVIIVTIIIATFTMCTTNTTTDKDAVLVDTTENTMVVQDSIKQFIKQINLKHADIVYAQAVLESNNFKSELFNNNNNMFGMKEPLVRNTVALGTKNGYAYYKSWQHSIIDYALYQSTYYHDSRRDYGRQDYLEKLARNYASDPKYISKVLDIVNKEKWN